MSMKASNDRMMRFPRIVMRGSFFFSIAMNFLLTAAAVFLKAQNQAILTRTKTTDLPLFEYR
jgi:large-conductance mechanosensitive channel